MGHAISHSRRNCAMTDPLRVLIVEDSPLIAQRLVTLVGTLPDSAVSGSVDSEAAACERLASDPIDVAILDINLRQGSGFGVLRYIQRLPRAPQSIVYTNGDLEPQRRAAFALGASHFMDKNRDFERVADLLTRWATAKAAGR